MKYVLLIFFLYSSTVMAQEYEILFTRQVSNNDNIFALNHKGTLRQITDHPRKDSSPSMSPDGKKIVFTSEREGWWKIWVMNSDGSDISQLTHASSAEYAPAWSPDSQKIAFVSGRRGGTQIFVMTKDGQNLTQLTSSGKHAMPHWAIDDKIYYSKEVSGTYQIWQMKSDGSNQQQLTQSGGDKLMPQLSPDRSRILYYGNQDGNMEIYVMELSTKKMLRLTHHPLMDIRARWSKDGRWIVFERGNKGNDQQIFIMNADGTNQKQLTQSGYNYAPSFAY